MHVEPLAEEAEVAHVGEQGQQRPPEAADIGEQHGLVVTLQLRPSELLDEFLERADAARQGDESVGALEHQLLALMHAVDNDEILRGDERVLALDQKLGDNPRDSPARRKRRARHAAHQAVAAAAENEADPAAASAGRERRPPRRNAGPCRRSSRNRRRRSGSISCADLRRGRGAGVKAAPGGGPSGVYVAPGVT